MTGPVVSGKTKIYSNFPQTVGGPLRKEHPGEEVSKSCFAVVCIAWSARSDGSQCCCGRCGSGAVSAKRLCAIRAAVRAVKEIGSLSTIGYSETEGAS